MPASSSPALLIAAPSSGSGKTVLTLALLRAFRKTGVDIGSFKVGPDYIDPAFHHRASGRPCYNIDSWAMREETVSAIFAEAMSGRELVIGEGVMGLFDGAQNGSGSTADIAAAWDLPVILVIDAKGQAASVGAVLYGFNTFRPDVKIAGVLFNRTGGPGHIRMLKEAAEKVGIPALGFVPRSKELSLNHRHLGLVQARETPELEMFLEKAAGIVADHVDLGTLKSLARGLPPAEPARLSTIAPLGQRIAIAEDDAFAFTYPHFLKSWRNAGVEINFFSPLADEAPDPDADAVYLPGGYPELFCERLSNAPSFKAGLRAAAEKGIPVYGECGGFMVLGESLTDKEGNTFPMLGLLPVTTSFALPKLHLGYRQAKLASDGILGPAGTSFKAHEFHYADLTSGQGDNPLFENQDARGNNLGSIGAAHGSIAGSFIHLIDRA